MPLVRASLERSSSELLDTVKKSCGMRTRTSVSSVSLIAAARLHLGVKVRYQCIGTVTQFLFSGGVFSRRKADTETRLCVPRRCVASSHVLTRRPTVFSVRKSTCGPKHTSRYRRDTGSVRICIAKLFMYVCTLFC